MADERSPELHRCPPSSLPLVLTVDEAARLLRVDRKTVYDGVRTGEIPARRLGRRILVLRDPLLRMLGAHTDGARTADPDEISWPDQVRVVPKGNDDDS